MCSPYPCTSTATYLGAADSWRHDLATIGARTPSNVHSSTWFMFGLLALRMGVSILSRRLWDQQLAERDRMLGER